MNKVIDLNGKKFGRWTITNRAESNKSGNAMWKCTCECGIEKVVAGFSLKSGVSKSCGCLNKELASSRKLVHGHNTISHVSSEYRTWANMKIRCFKVNSNRYKNYGGKGITICERWLNFENFLADMGEKPTEKHSIDRIDVNGNYEPNNCKWATPSEQARNRGIRKANNTGVNGVHFYNNTQKYAVSIGANYKTISIGYTYSLEEAKRMRAEAEIKYWGKPF